jgi:hypothetical protein
MRSASFTRLTTGAIPPSAWEEADGAPLSSVFQKGRRFMSIKIALDRDYPARNG